MLFVNTLSRVIKSSEKRSDKIKKNILGSFLIRGLSILINFSVVPLTIQYIDPVRYGIWLTLASIISWFTFFDFGMGNGLRNNVVTALAHNEYDKAKKYISTAYGIFTLIAIVVFGLFCLVNPHINWNDFLNVPQGFDENIHLILLVVLGAFCIQFVVQLLNTVFISLQEPAKAELVTLLGQVALLITLIVLKLNIKGSLGILVVALNIAPVSVLFLAGLVLYNTRLKKIAPSFRSIDFAYAKNILNLGGSFFLIQLGAMILFQTDNILITKTLGPESVTKFNVAYRLYSVIIMAFSIIVTPYWSAFTDAWAKQDYGWINRSIKRLREVWLFISFIIVPIFFLASKYLFKLWIGDSVKINLSLSISMAVYVMCYTCLALNCYFLNGIGKLRVQLLLYLLVILTNVPLGLILGKWLGIEGVVLANIIAFVVINVILWIQTNKIVSNKATGIWFR